MGKGEGSRKRKRGGERGKKEGRERSTTGVRRRRL